MAPIPDDLPPSAISAPTEHQDAEARLPVLPQMRPPPLRSSLPEEDSLGRPGAADHSDLGPTAPVAPAPQAAAEPPASETPASETPAPALSDRMTSADLGGAPSALQADDLPPPPPEPDSLVEGMDSTGTPAAKRAEADRAYDVRRETRTASLNAPSPVKSAAIGAPNVGSRPVTVAFEAGAATLDAVADAVIQRVADRYHASGNRIRIVGHAIGKAADRTPGDHTLANFELSLKRATAVSDALIALGVNPGAIVVEAVGDRPAAADNPGAGASSAEIYLE